MAVNERIDDEALETRSNNNYGKSGANKALIWYAKDVCSGESTRKTLGRLDLDLRVRWCATREGGQHAWEQKEEERAAQNSGSDGGQQDHASALWEGGQKVCWYQASLKLLLLLLELLKLGFSDRLVGIETAPAFSETQAESSFTPPNPALPLLFAERVPTARSQREFEDWWVCLFPTKVGSLEGRVGEPGIGVFC